MGRYRWIPVLLGPVLWALVGGCAHRAPAPEPPPPELLAEAGALPDDGQGLELFLAKNRGILELARTAADRAEASEPVRGLARELAEEHRAFAERLSAVASREGLAPEATPESRRLRTEDEARLAALRDAGPDGFDGAWLRAAAAAHERLRQRLDGVLVPAARNEAYRAALLDLRPRVVAHLEALARALEVAAPP